MEIKIANLIKDSLWVITHPIESKKRCGTLGKLDFLKHLGKYRDTHPELKPFDDIQLLNAWQQGRFDFH